MKEIEKILTEYESKGYEFKEAQIMRSGKEAVVYCVEADGKRYALKIYKNPRERSFQEASTYLEGKFYKRPSVRKAVLKGNRFARKFLHTSWVKREYSLLKHLNTLNAAVPRVYDWTDSSVLMEFIGGAEPAPRLIDIQLNSNDAAAAFNAILDTIKLFLQAGVIHSDLSAYNVLWWQEKPYIIDFPQAIDIRHSPNVAKLLKRDVDNIITYFKNYPSVDIKSAHELYSADQISEV